MGPAGFAADEARRAVRLHELSLPEEARRALGAHYTPAALADRLVHLAFSSSGLAAGELPELVCDPSCGAGSILVSLAEELHSRGAAPAEVLARHLIGCDIDPAAVRAARTSLVAWAVAAGEPDPPEPRIVEADALGLPGDFPQVDVIVGNPPFASPLSADVARRRRSGGATGAGTAISSAGRDGAYVDDSALHLRAAVELVAPGGVVCLLQPQSLLGSRDAASVRAAVSKMAVLEVLWASGEDMFEEAAVRVCAPVLVRSRDAVLPGLGAPVDPLVIWQDEPAARVPFDPAGSWAPLLAGAVGTPQVRIAGGLPLDDHEVRVGDLARCTAGFRDEFYALASIANESATGEHVVEGTYRLVTAGMIDPGVNRWGTGSWRLAGRRFTAPLAELSRLELSSPRVARWGAARAVPKVLVASQTKVLEAAVDAHGGCVPVTPVVSVEPTGECSPAALAAMLSAPANSALMATGAAGSGRSSAALRVGASAVASLMVSADPAQWSAAERLWVRVEAAARERASAAQWFAIGVELNRLLGPELDEGSVAWWVHRLPDRLVQREHLT